MDRTYFWAVPTAVISVLALIVALNTSVAAPAPPGADPQVIEVRLTDFTIEPSTIQAKAGQPVTLRISNVGGAPHNLAVVGQGRSAVIDGGESTVLELGPLEAGSYDLLCEVAGHGDLGMVGTLEVSDDAVASRAADHGAMDSDEMDHLYTMGVESFPAETEGLGGQLLEPRMDGGVKVFELTAAEIDWEVAPGDVRKAMAYNGQVPGPEIRVSLGDRVRVILHNELSETTSIHFHGLDVPYEQDGVPLLTQPMVKSGESYTYEFTVPNSGSHMYHSHMNGAHQIPMGLLGAFIVEGPDEPQVDQDIVMVLNDGPLGYTINGKGFPATQPIVASPGDTIRIRYMNEGLQGHPMHLHGMAQTVYARDGYPLPAPYKADTIWVAPGERHDVLITARAGVWAFHCHILTHAEDERGMFGMVTVMIVE